MLLNLAKTSQTASTNKKGQAERACPQLRLRLGNAYAIRGDLAYEVALRVLRSVGEEHWLIPTSGHRAYPLAYKALASVLDGMTEL